MCSHVKDSHSYCPIACVTKERMAIHVFYNSTCMRMGFSFQQNLPFQAKWKKNTNGRKSGGLPLSHSLSAVFYPSDVISTNIVITLECACTCLSSLSQMWLTTDFYFLKKSSIYSLLCFHSKSRNSLEFDRKCFTGVQRTSYRA